MVTIVYDPKNDNVEITVNESKETLSMKSFIDALPETEIKRLEYILEEMFQIRKRQLVTTEDIMKRLNDDARKIDDIDKTQKEIIDSDDFDIDLKTNIAKVEAHGKRVDTIKGKKDVISQLRLVSRMLELDYGKKKVEYVQLKKD